MSIVIIGLDSLRNLDLSQQVMQLIDGQRRDSTGHDVNSNCITTQSNKINILMSNQCGYTNSGAAPFLIAKAVFPHMVDEPGVSIKSPDAFGGVMGQSGKSDHRSVEVLTNDNSQSTLRKPPTMDWPHTVASKEIFGSVEEEEDTKDYLDGEEPDYPQSGSSYKDCNVQFDASDDSDRSKMKMIWKLLEAFQDVFGVITTKGAALVDPFTV
jgi:hypothetical protein